MPFLLERFMVMGLNCSQSFVAFSNHMGLWCLHSQFCSPVFLSPSVAINNDRSLKKPVFEGWWP